MITNKNRVVSWYPHNRWQASRLWFLLQFQLLHITLVHLAAQTRTCW